MKRSEFLKRKISSYLAKEQLLKKQEYAKLEKPFLSKARKNFTVANLLFKITEKEELRKSLNLASDFDMYDWVIIASYYAMYTSALAALAKLWFRSKSHAATTAVLEYQYVHKKKMEDKHVDKLFKAYALSEKLITKLIETKTRRETAQYDATSSISKENAKSALESADEFITKVEEILG